MYDRKLRLPVEMKLKCEEKVEEDIFKNKTEEVEEMSQNVEMQWKWIKQKRFLEGYLK